MNQKPEIKYKRWYQKKLLVNSKVQFVFLKYALCMGFLFLSLGMFLAISIERILNNRLTGADLITPGEYLFFALAIFLVFAACYFGLVVSNQIVGPIFRLVRNMEEFESTGKFEQIKFRKNDYFKEIAVSYNKIMLNLKS